MIPRRLALILALMILAACATKPEPTRHGGWTSWFCCDTEDGRVS